MNSLPNRVVTITVARKSRKELIMLVKEIREILEKTLGKFYADADFAVASTKVMDDFHEFRIEFRIYDAEFWMGINTVLEHVYIESQSFGEAGAGIISIWFRPYRYDKKRSDEKDFSFGWRTDLESFFDAFHATLLEKVKETQKTTAASVYGSSTKAAEIGEGEAGASVIAAILDGLDTKKDETKDCNKPSIFNSLKDDEDEDLEW